MRPPTTLLLTRDPAVVHVVTQVVACETIEWRRTFSAALTAITADVETLIVDVAAGVPMAQLMATLFVQQQPGRSAVVIERAEAAPGGSPDERVAILPRTTTALELLFALQRAGMASAAALARSESPEPVGVG